MTRPRTIDLPVFRTCSHPGCDKRMWRGSGTYDAMLCAEHGGKRIGKAAVLPFVPEPEKPLRPGVRVVEVPYPTSNSGVALRAKVSLVKEPWL